jgi:hypothetical protein
VIEVDVPANNKTAAYTAAKTKINQLTFGDTNYVKDSFELSREVEELPSPIVNGDTPSTFTSQSLDRFDG